MPTLTADNWVDLVAFTLKKYEKNRATNLMSDLQSYYALSKMMETDGETKKPKRITFQSYRYQWQLLMDHTHAARNKGLMETDPNANIPDIGAQAEVPFRHSDTNWSFDEVAVAEQGTAEKILDLVKTQEMGAMQSLHDLMESNWWAAPVYDDTTPWGLKYGICANAVSGTSEPGFIGDVASGFSTKYGLSPTTYSKLRNYAFAYQVSDVDALIADMRLASWSCNFRSPVNIIPDIAGGSDYGYYTTYTIWALLLQEARSQNTELGPDLDPLSSTMRFQRIPIHAVPYLTTNNTYPVNPIYGINWNTWKLALLKGEFLKRRGPFRSPTCHTTHTTWIDCTYNWACVDPRRNFVGYTSTTT